MILKTWVPAVVVVAGVAAAIWHVWEREVVPAMLASANEELLADLRGAVEERAAAVRGGKEVAAEGDPGGVMEVEPAVGDQDRFVLQMTRRKGVDGEVVPDGFLAGRSAVARGNRFVDAWGQPLRHELVEGRYRVTSAGADGKFSTGDDQTSDGARSRFEEPVKGGKKKSAEKEKVVEKVVEKAAVPGAGSGS
ncbi:MAG: hypothetical protein DVB22_001788 [Verrucomicrobia bacterium]|nr:MAG: hypothetical protein DVB22_001788 [Verrucomicrobiota bacterium]